MRYVNMVKGFTKEDYEKRNSFSRVDECEASISLDGFGGVLANPIQAVKIDGKIFFKRKNDNDILPFYYAEHKDEQYNLYELTYKAYCKYGF